MGVFLAIHEVCVNCCEPSLKIKVSYQSKLLVVMWAQRMTTEVILTIFHELRLTALPGSEGFVWFTGFSLCAWSPRCLMLQRRGNPGASCLCDLGTVSEHSWALIFLPVKQASPVFLGSLSSEKISGVKLGVVPQRWSHLHLEGEVCLSQAYHNLNFWGQTLHCLHSGDFLGAYAREHRSGSKEAMSGEGDLGGPVNCSQDCPGDS